jgi:hypothetical protein
MARSRNTADTQTASGGPVSPSIAGKNAVINGGMDVWQRGTSFTASGVYTADRWYNGSNTGQTFTRQTTSDTTNLPFIQYCLRASRNSGTSNTNIVGVSQSIETVNSIRFAGQTVTVSFYARKGANLSGTFIADFYSGTGTDQRRDFGAGFTGETVVVTSSPSLTTGWVRYTMTGNVPTTATELAVLIYFIPVGTAGAADYFEVTGVQLELGSVATPFSRAQGTIQGELAACQRYYWRSTATANYSVIGAGGGNATGTTTARLFIANPVNMRTTPSSIDYGGALACSDGVTLYGTGSFTIQTNSTPAATHILYTHGSGVLTQYRWYNLQDNNANTAYVGVSAEL